jgi:hypothetical protein
MPIEPVTAGSEDDRTFETFADSQVDSASDAGSEGHRDELAALTQHRQGAASAFEPKCFDVGADRRTGT